MVIYTKLLDLSRTFCMPLSIAPKGSGFEKAAREATRMALALDPQDAESNLRLAKWAIAAGNVARARTILEAVVSANPDLIAGRVLLAQVYNRLKLRKEAETQQEIIKGLEAQAQRREPGQDSEK